MMFKRANVYRVGFYYYLLSSGLLGLIFLFYLLLSPQLSFMDFGGWLFYLAACLSQASIFSLIPFVLLYLLPCWLGSSRKLALILSGIGFVLQHTYFIINGLVFGIYRFHINGMVINMLLGSGSGDIFDFNVFVYLKVILMESTITIVNLLLIYLSKRLVQLPHYCRLYMPSFYVWAFLMLFTNFDYAYAAAVQKASVVKSATFIPYYFPLQANKLLWKMGFVSRERFVRMDFEKPEETDVVYPKHPIVEGTLKGEPLNVIILAIDSWNKRTLSPECMPNTCKFAQGCEDYTNHLSSSNGTRGSIFGMFYGVPSYYWTDFDLSSFHPVLLHELLKHGYDVHVYPSATLLNPPFAKNVFREVPHLLIQAKGETIYDRDCDITRRMLADLNKYNGSRPFFSFIFYNLAHGIELSKDKLYRFKPTWDYADYTKLSNDMNPTPFFNLYRNCVAEVDSLTGLIYQTLAKKGLLKNTVVIITGDHGQEFNENHKDYWGHGSNFTKAQICIPFLYYYPGCKPRQIKYRTTHYDVAPTLLRKVLGVKNPPSDYSIGRLLSDPSSRDWHIVGDNLQYGFILSDDRIVEKKAVGNLEMYDGHMNTLNENTLNAHELNAAIKKLNGFYK
jgi:membrane-anchored protein YejM (alkaline phosphatase superfamily)